MKLNLRLLLIFLVTISLFSCKKGGDSEFDSEMRRLNAWVKVNNIDVTPTASGMYFISVKEGTGDFPVDLDYVYYNYSIETLDGDIVYSTVDSIADSWGHKVKMSYYGPAIFRLDAFNYDTPTGVIEAVKMMKVGGKARLILPSTLASAANGKSALSSNTSVIFNVELVAVVKDIAVYEKELVTKYAKDSSYTIPITDKAGIFYKVLIPKDEADVNKFMKDSAKTVYVRYTGRFLNGTIFDTNILAVAETAGIEDLDKSYSLLSVELGLDQVVPAFEEVIKMMWKKETFKFITTSEFAYGAKGQRDSKDQYYVIPPYTPLVFEITIDTYVKK